MASRPRALRLAVALLSLGIVASACSTTVTITAPEAEQSTGGPPDAEGSTSGDQPDADGSTSGSSPDAEGGAPDTADDGGGVPGPMQGRAVWSDADCEFDEPPKVSTRCGWLQVPERWDDEAGANTLRLHVGIFSTGPKDTEPIVYLEGGPGGDALANIGQGFDTLFGTTVQHHDIIVLGQRGTGSADPHLQCAEVLDLSIELLDTPPDDATEADLYGDAYGRCAARFAGEGIDTSVYNSIQNAYDVDALRVALGFDQWNVLGVSYGTRLGQTLLRRHPEGVRAIVLDSVLPTERDPSVDQPVTAQRAFEELWAGCAESAVCGPNHPELERRYFELVDQLDAEPIELEINNVVTAEKYDAVVDGGGLLEVTFSALYSRSAFAALPELVDQLEVGDTSGLASLASQSITSEAFIANGMFWSVECNEEVPFISEEATADGLTGDPRYDRLRPPEALALIDSICTSLDPGVAPAIEDELVTSDVPALVLAGSYDPITPPENGRSILAGLPNGNFIELPHTGHGAIADPCGQQLVVAFLADPSEVPDASCTGEISEPPWAPDVFAELEFEAFSFDAGLYSASGVRPVGWDDLGDGTFAQIDNSLHTSVVLQQVIPAAPTSLLLGSFEGVLGVDLEEVDELVVGGRSWTRYSAPLPGSIIDVVIASDDGFSYVVVLQNAPSDRDAAIDNLLVPTLEAIAP